MKKIMFQLDEYCSRAIFECTKKSIVLTKFAIFCGSFLIWLMLGFAIGMGNAHLPTLALMVFLPWAITLIISSIVKRPRPFESEHYKPILKLFVYTNSFPSAHSTVAFALAFAFTNKPLFDPFVAATLFTGALLVALGRVAIGVHYLSDVFMGALIGKIGFFLVIMPVVFFLLFNMAVGMGGYPYLEIPWVYD